MTHTLALLGDSSIDNAAYARNTPPVVQHVRSKLGSEWKVVQGAVDGDVISSVPTRLRQCLEATHIVLSVGGNNALGLRYILEERVGFLGNGLIRLAEEVRTFRENYAQLLSTLRKHTQNIITCLIYEPQFHDALQQQACVAALVHFNDAILRASMVHGLSVIDLRTVCTETEDIVRGFEPSGQGGRKIGETMARVVSTHDFAQQITRVYTGRV